jgi:nucleoid DNA-binding protein
MKRKELAKELAREQNLSQAAALDQLDEIVHRVVESLRRGQTAEMPGVGELVAQTGVPQQLRAPKPGEKAARAAARKDVGR